MYAIIAAEKGFVKHFLILLSISCLHKSLNIAGIHIFLNLSVFYQNQGRRLHNPKLAGQFWILLCVHYLIIHTL